MTDAAGAPDLIHFGRRRASRGSPVQACIGAAAITVSVVSGACWLVMRPVPAPDVVEAPPVAPKRLVAAMLPLGVFGPGFSSGMTPASLAESTPLAAALQWSQPDRPAPPAEADAVVELPLPTPASSPLVESTALATAEAVPLPTPRPAEFSVQADAAPVRGPSRQLSRSGRMAAAPMTPADNRGFFAKLFGVSQPSGPALAYAAPETSVVGGLQSLTATPMPYDRATAVYDIAAHTVYMPDGTQLEAHSGLGPRLDDPRYVHERMHGPTPPHVYDLKLRETLFHGVRALRLTPVGGGSVFGRTGLLAHTYMLGPNGDSNGCVSFRNYDAFLQAFENGNVKRLAVVTRRS